MFEEEGVAVVAAAPVAALPPGGLTLARLGGLALCALEVWWFEEEMGEVREAARREGQGSRVRRMRTRWRKPRLMAA